MEIWHREGLALKRSGTTGPQPLKTAATLNSRQLQAFHLLHLQELPDSESETRGPRPNEHEARAISLDPSPNAEGGGHLRQAMESFRASRFSAHFILQYFTVTVSVTVRGYLASPSLSSRRVCENNDRKLELGGGSNGSVPRLFTGSGSGSDQGKVRHRRRAVPKSDQHGSRLLFGPVAAIAAAQRRNPQIPQILMEKSTVTPPSTWEVGRLNRRPGRMARIGWRAWKWKCPPLHRRGAPHPAWIRRGHTPPPPPTIFFLSRAPWRASILPWSSIHIPHRTGKRGESAD